MADLFTTIPIIPPSHLRDLLAVETRMTAWYHKIAAIKGISETLSFDSSGVSGKVTSITFRGGIAIDYTTEP